MLYPSFIRKRAGTVYRSLKISKLAAILRLPAKLSDELFGARSHSLMFQAAAARSVKAPD